MTTHLIRLRVILFGLLGIFLASTITPTAAQPMQRPSPLQKARTSFRRSANPTRPLDSIRVRFHDVDKTERADAINNSTANAAPMPLLQELVTQILSDATLQSRGVPSMTRMRGHPKLGIQVYKLDDPSRRDEALAKLRKMPEVRYAEPVQAVHPLLPPPNDTYYNLLDTTSSFFENSWLYQWQLHSDFVNALGGWSRWPNQYYTAAQKILAPGPRIAIIDTGIDYLHPDFVNAGGFTTDAALGGQIDLANSYDFNGQTDDPLDLVGHGTHVAGIAAAATNNGAGVAAIGYPARIMALNVFDESANGDDVDVIDAMIWAADHGAVVCNLSLAADGGYSQGLQDAVDYCWARNTLIVAAAGNDGVDYVRRYPGACNKVLCVAATGFAGPSTLAGEGLAIYSTYGTQVSVAAPGGDFSYWSGGELGLTVELNTLIWSSTPTYPVTLVPPGDYGYQQGTSMAAPHVTGLAALYAGFKGFTQATPNAPRQIIKAIQRGADNLNGRIDGGWSITTGYGRINVEATMLERLGLNRLANGVYTPGGVTGQVTYYGTPVLNASIRLQAVGQKGYSANSRDDGTYRLPNVYPAVYTVICYWQGIVRTRTITVEQGCDTVATDFAMEPGSNISVTVTPESVTLPLNGTQQFSATVTGTANTGVTWSVASGPGTVSSTGLYTAPGTGPTPATATVVATSAADPTRTDSATVFLLPTPQTLTLNPNPVTGGSSATGTVVLTGAAPPGGATVTLSSSNTSVATVPANIVIPAGSTTGSFTVSTVAVATNTSVNIGATYGGATLTAALTVNKPGGTTIRINCGGPLFTGTNGNVFASDVHFTGGATLTRTANIANTSDPALYHTMRYGASFGYSIPVPNGTYTLKLHFAETNFTSFGVGLRTMNISINGVAAYSGLDIFAEVGSYAALVKTRSVSVTNGRLDISLAKQAGSFAIINAIEIIP